MASELRWILLALSAALLIGIWWWGMRRSRRSPGDAQLREPPTGTKTMSPAAGPTAMGPVTGSAAAEPTLGEPVVEARSGDLDSADWGVPPFEPLSIRTADFDEVHLMDLPMSASPEPLDAMVTLETGTADIAARSGPTPARNVEPPPQDPPQVRPVAAPAAAPKTSETQRIVTVRVCSLGETQWPGADLLAALEHHGLGYGRYKVFHRKHSDGRTLFCAASLVEPGTFDIARMPETQYRGLTLFAVLPGPADALDTLDTLIATAVDLADTLHGAVQDADGAPLSAQRAEALREEVARFQESLSMS